MNPHDGAFPVPDIREGRYYSCSEGLTKKEYIAIEMMQAFIKFNTVYTGLELDAVADFAVRAAEALVKRLNQE